MKEQRLCVILRNRLCQFPEQGTTTAENGVRVKFHGILPCESMRSCTEDFKNLIYELRL